MFFSVSMHMSGFFDCRIFAQMTVYPLYNHIPVQTESDCLHKYPLIKFYCYIHWLSIKSVDINKAKYKPTFSCISRLEDSYQYFIAMKLTAVPLTTISICGRAFFLFFFFLKLLTITSQSQGRIVLFGILQTAAFRSIIAQRKGWHSLMSWC